MTVTAYLMKGSATDLVLRVKRFFGTLSFRINYRALSYLAADGVTLASFLIALTIFEDFPPALLSAAAMYLLSRLIIFLKYRAW